LRNSRYRNILARNGTGLHQSPTLNTGVSKTLEPVEKVAAEPTGDPAPRQNAQKRGSRHPKQGSGKGMKEFFNRLANPRKFISRKLNKIPKVSEGKACFCPTVAIPPTTRRANTLRS
jgi:hypothetical protein